MRIGHVPANGVLLAAARIDGARWELYEVFYKNREPDECWQSLKLIVRARRPKANYWIGWNIEEERFSNARDWRTLKEREPAAAAWCEAVLRDPEVAALIYGP